MNKLKQEKSIPFVKVTVYIPLEVKEYLKKRRVSVSQWCRKAIEKKMKYFKKIVFLYHTNPQFKEHRKNIKYKSREKARREGRRVT